MTSATRPDRRDRAAGFSLLEILIAMMILAIGAASVLSLFAAAASTHRRALDRTQAALIAERVLAEARARYAGDQTASSLSAELRRDLPERFGEYGWDVFLWRPATGRGDGGEGDAEWDPDELLVRVSVSWRRSGRGRAESFWTILLPGRGEGDGRSRRRDPRRSGGGRSVLLNPR